MKRVPSASPLHRFTESAAREEVTAWLKANAVRLASFEPDADLGDLTPLIPRLRDARVVAMGEAPHGTREFQQLKARMFGFLVEKLGFTVFGIEANWPEVLTVNEYVPGADVDPAPGLVFAWWKTEEFALLRWMRDYNRDPAHLRKLKFYGFDMQIPGLAASNVLAYLRRVDPALVGSAGRVFDVMGGPGENRERGTASSVTALLRRFDERKAEWVEKTSLREWTMARQHLTIVMQGRSEARGSGRAGEDLSRPGDGGERPVDSRPGAGGDQDDAVGAQRPCREGSARGCARRDADGRPSRTVLRRADGLVRVRIWRGRIPRGGYGGRRHSGVPGGPAAARPPGCAARRDRVGAVRHRPARRAGVVCGAALLAPDRRRVFGSGARCVDAPDADGARARSGDLRGPTTGSP